MRRQLKQGTNTNNLKRRLLMLTPSYAAIEQFQRKKFSVDTLEALKLLLKSLNLSLDLRITSSSFWETNWNLLEDKFSGTLEIKVDPILIFKQEIFQPKHSTTFRLEEAEGITMASLEFKFLEVIKQSIETIC